jgi:hypothetical protein
MTAEGDGTDEGDAAVRSPEGVFALLGDGTRMGILRALWEQYDPYAADNAVPFSELYERVGADDTGNFNYHLGRLTGHFVRRTAAGYELTAPGFSVVRAVVAGGVTGDPTRTPARVDATCTNCGAPVAVSYEDGPTWVRCPACEGYWPRRGGEILGFGLPPTGLRDRDPDGVLAATLVYAVRRFETMSDGVCPECGGAVDASLAACADHDPAGGVCDACDSRFLGVVTFVCDVCRFAWRCPGYAPVSHHPAVVSFYHDRGIEHRPATWAGLSRGVDWREERLSTDPPSLRITVSHDGERLRLTLDETGTVVDVDPRVDRDPGSDDGER